MEIWNIWNIWKYDPYSKIAVMSTGHSKILVNYLNYITILFNNVQAKEY